MTGAPGTGRRRHRPVRADPVRKASPLPKGQGLRSRLTSRIALYAEWGKRMATNTITKTCPFCRKVYEQRSFYCRGKTVTEEERWLFGSPMRMCPHCKKMFCDKDVRELAITGMRKQDKAFITPGSLKVSAMGIILGGLMLLAKLTTFGYIAMGVGLLWGVADLCLYPTRMKKMEKERQASEKRLSDPAYARMLKNAGYEVPQRYLPEGEIP